ncbi:MAG: FAD synthetase family protein [Alphaproteobacteria bacterium]
MTVVAIGNFDGLHAGHRALLAVASHVARAEDMPLVVLTFEPHPRAVLSGKPLQRLMQSNEKLAALHAAGVDEVVVLPFTPEFAQTTPQQFIDDILGKTLQAKHVVVGENFRFGHKAGGHVALLQAQKQFTTHAVPLLRDAGGVVSSSRLRG